MTEWPNVAIIAVFIATMVVIAGCDSRPQQEEIDDDTPTSQEVVADSRGFPIRVYQDPETGCEYLLTKEGGITPRMVDKGGADAFSNPQKGCTYDINRE